MSTMAAKAEREFRRDEETRSVRNRTCTSCGHLCDNVGEFHPHMFCVLKKAGRLDPWGDFKWAVEQLGLSVPRRPPLVRDLPLTTEGNVVVGERGVKS